MRCRVIVVFVTVFFCLEMPRPLFVYIAPYIMVYEEMYNLLSVLSIIDSCANVLIYFSNDCIFRSHMKVSRSRLQNMRPLCFAYATSLSGGLRGVTEAAVSTLLPHSMH